MKKNVVGPHARARTAARSLVGVSLLAWSLAGILSMSHAQSRQPDSASKPPAPSAVAESKGLETATFGSGCFWCAEAVFRRLKGVRSVVPGYSGGRVKSPTYKQVCTGKTGHAEVVQITFDPKEISYAELLEVFWKTHDPTTLNRQGPDFGTQYRSVVFYHNDQQRKTAEQCKSQLDAAGAFGAPIVTRIVPFREFYRAEDYHQDYFELHPQQPYCAAYIRPKVEKLEKVFHDKLKAPASGR